MRTVWIAAVFSSGATAPESWNPHSTLSAIANELAEATDHVSLIYAPVEARPVEPDRGSGRKADHRWIVRGHCRPSRCLTMAASSSVTMSGCEKAPPVDSGGAFVRMVTWWSSAVTRDHSLFSVMADCAAARSTIALSAA